MKRAVSLFAAVGMAMVFAGCSTTNPGHSEIKLPKRATKTEINQRATQAIQNLYDTVPLARELSKSAKAILIFPRITKAGLMIGGQSGDGVLVARGKTVGYYNTSAASYGLQAGAQQFSYVLFFMTDEAIEYVRQSDGWEVGVGPTLVLVDEGVSKTLTTTTANDDIYAFIFGQKGLMAGLGITGSKVTPIDPAP